MENIINATETNLAQLLQQPDITILVDFWAPWCGPCRALGPELEKIAAELQDKILILKVNVDENENLSAQYGIRGIPAVFVFKNGKQVSKFVGMKSKNDIMNIITPTL